MRPQTPIPSLHSPEHDDLEHEQAFYTHASAAQENICAHRRQPTLCFVFVMAFSATLRMPVSGRLNLRV